MSGIVDEREIETVNVSLENGTMISADGNSSLVKGNTVFQAVLNEDSKSNSGQVKDDVDSKRQFTINKSPITDNFTRTEEEPVKDSLHSEIEKLSSRLKYVCDQCDSVKKEFDKSDRMKKELQESKQKYERLQKELQESEQRNDSIKSALKETEKAKDRLIDEIKELRSLVVEKMQQTDQLHLQLVEIQSQLKQFQVTHAREMERFQQFLKEQRATSKVQTELFQTLLRQRDASIQALQDQINNLKQQH